MDYINSNLNEYDLLWLRQSEPKHENMADILWIVTVCGKVVTETVVTIFNVAEVYFFSSLSEASNKIKRKSIVYMLLMNS